MPKKYISWNVNGLRACLDKGFMDFFDKVDADAVCLQEIKLSEGQLDCDFLKGGAVKCFLRYGN